MQGLDAAGPPAAVAGGCDEDMCMVSLGQAGYVVSWVRREFGERQADASLLPARQLKDVQDIIQLVDCLLSPGGNAGAALEQDQVRQWAQGGRKGAVLPAEQRQPRPTVLPHHASVLQHNSLPCA